MSDFHPPDIKLANEGENPFTIALTAEAIKFLSDLYVKSTGDGSVPRGQDLSSETAEKMSEQTNLAIELHFCRLAVRHLRFLVVPNC